MSVIVFIETDNQVIRKASLEAVSYGAALAKMMNKPTCAVVLGSLAAGEAEKIGKYGATKVLHVDQSKLNQGIAQAFTTILAKAVEKENAEVIIFTKSSIADVVAGRLSGILKAASVANVVSLPDLSSGFKVRRSIYTGKAFAQVELTSAKKIITIKKNAYSAVEISNQAIVEKWDITPSDTDFAVSITNTEKVKGDILLPDAEIVVSAGRGLKGPENWSIIENLAKALKAATACSKPVSDLHWRPHHEHVGQTGIKVSPNLYIAIGISGAIQHLAGVNSSKVIVVINKDPEAPFFKAADYGVVGDLFEIVPKLTKAVEKALN